MRGRFGSTGPLTVDGTAEALTSEYRYDNPWTKSRVGAQRVEIADEHGFLTLDLEDGEREIGDER